MYGAVQVTLRFAENTGGSFLERGKQRKLVGVGHQARLRSAQRWLRTNYHKIVKEKKSKWLTRKMKDPRKDSRTVSAVSVSRRDFPTYFIVSVAG
jgi:hypothetical protein